MFGAKEIPFDPNRRKVLQEGVKVATGAVAVSIMGPAMFGQNEAQAAPVETEYTAEQALLETVQMSLHILGFLSERPTGKYDEQTVAAVKAYQKSKGIEITGDIKDIDLNQLAMEALSKSI